jgi:hypothetical protein
MTSPEPPADLTAPIIDIGCALDLLAAAVKQYGEYFVYPPVWVLEQRCLYAGQSGPRCLVGQALSLAQVADGDLEPLGHLGVRELYTQGRLPVRLTLGALAVFDAAQRSQDCGYAWGDALEYASHVAMRYLDLLPDAAVPAATVGEEQTCP